MKDQGAHIISLSWTPPTDNGGSGVTEYAVTATPDPNDAFGPADGGSLSVSTRQTEVDVPGLAADVNYTFTVRALNAAGAGPESKATDPQKVPCVFAPDVGPDAGPSTPQPDNESENDSDEEGAALVAMRPVVRASCLRCPGPPVACEVGHTVFGEWGSGNATLTFSHAGGCRYDGEFSQVDGEGNTPGFVSEKISFGAPVGEKAVQELLRKCSCDVETVDKDEGGRPAAYHCKAESDGVMDFTDTYTLTRDSGQRITSLTRKL